MSITQTLIMEQDDDGKAKRTGNVWTAVTHIITVVVGAGVLALAWAMAQLGWIAGIGSIVIFASISIFTYSLVADCYRFPDPITGKRNYTYMQAVKSYLVLFDNRWNDASDLWIDFVWKVSWDNSGLHNYFIDKLSIFLSQIPNFHKLTWISTIAAITSFGYVFIAVGLCLTVLISGKGASTSITGTQIGPELTAAEKVWRVCTSMGNIALASTYATVIYDIMDTLKSHPPENKQMKRANVTGVSMMTMIFLLCSCLGYAAFGDHTPGNIFFGFYEPYWIVALGEVCIVIHMIGAYQVMAQPFFRVVEMGANIAWPDSKFINQDHSFNVRGATINLNLFRLIWRTIFVILATILAMAMPFFNQFLALLGAIGFGPLVVFFPIQMHIAQKRIPVLSLRWCALQLLNCLCMVVSLAAVVASVHEISENIHKYKIFAYKQ